MTKKGLLSKSPHFIWQGVIRGTRYEARAVCMDCARAFVTVPPEPPEVPGTDLPEWADLMLEDHGFIEEADNLSTLRHLDTITNVPERDMEAVEETLERTTGCPIDGHDSVHVFWGTR